MSSKTAPFRSLCLAVGLTSSFALTASATDMALLDVLLQNGLISQAQYDQLMEKEEVTAADVLSTVSVEESPQVDSPEITEAELASSIALDENVQRAIDDAFDAYRDDMKKKALVDSPVMKVYTKGPTTIGTLETMGRLIRK